VNNFSTHWKLVIVAGIALMLAAIVVPAMAAPVPEIAPGGRSAMAAPALEIAPGGRFADHRSAWTEDGVDQARRLSPGAIIGLICAIAASSVALGVAFGLRRRIDRIAGPDPDKADDD
jgi:hypothetical protein